MARSRIFDGWLRGYAHPAGESEDWQDAVQRELLDQQARGIGRREMVERLARQMYAEDVREIGQIADLGFFTWQLYIGASQFVTGYLLPAPSRAEQEEVPRAVDQGRRIA